MILKLRSQVVLRVENEDYAILYDADSEDAFVVDPVGVFICQRLDGMYTIEQIAAELPKFFCNVPANAAVHVGNFVQNLMAQDLLEPTTPLTSSTTRSLTGGIDSSL
jgi:hypothetical protein